QVFTGDTSLVSGSLKEIPNLPVIVMSQDEVTLDVTDSRSKARPAQVTLRKDDWTRWNDYGIGLLLQGDLKGAQAAFAKITEIDLSILDAWVNLGGVPVQEGDLERGRVVLGRALA